MKYTLFFTPERLYPGDPTSPLVLTPIVVAENGESLAMKKAVKSVKQAAMFEAGFTLAQFIEKEGGFDSLKAVVEARDDEERQLTLDLDEPLAPTVEDGIVPNADEGC